MIFKGIAPGKGSAGFEADKSKYADFFGEYLPSVSLARNSFTGFLNAQCGIWLGEAITFMRGMADLEANRWARIGIIEGEDSPAIKKAFFQGVVDGIPAKEMKNFDVNPCSIETLFNFNHLALRSICYYRIDEVWYPLFATTGNAVFLLKPKSDEEFVYTLIRRLNNRHFFKQYVPVTPKQLMIGADVEYSIIDADGVFHSATEFFKDDQNSSIGTDGNVDTVEIRPEPSDSPEGLVDNIEEILDATKSVLPPGYDLFCGGGREHRRNIGLHIHFSNTVTDTNIERGDDKVRLLINALDEMIAAPLLKFCTGTLRFTKEYGQYGDYRSKLRTGGDGHFPHYGFEWRVLPNICMDKRTTLVFMRMAYLIVDTLNNGQDIILEQAFSNAWFNQLRNADKHQDEIRDFMKIIVSGTNFNVPTLNRWFGKKFEKDKDCEVKVKFANTDFLDVAPFLSYNPQRRFKQIIFFTRGEGNQFIISTNGETPLEEIRKLIFEITNRLCNIKDAPEYIRDTFDKEPDTIFIGIPRRYAETLANRNRGSRNFVRMFAQNLSKQL